jgi:hypothetical protein
MITREQHRDWMTNYGNRVGLNADGGMEMLASWFFDFERMGLTIDQVKAASEIAIRRITDNPPRMREHHRSIFFAAIKNVVPTGVIATRELIEKNKQVETPADYAEFRRELEKRGWRRPSVTTKQGE